MRVLFCGSGTFAVPVLEALVKSRHEVASIITQPARPAGRGGKLRPTPVAEAAGEMELDLTAWININSDEAMADIQRIAPEVICVVDFGQFVRREVCEIAPRGAFNLHGSLLPELRGAGPVNWAIIRGYEKTGVTTFSLVDRMDAGPIYLTRETDIAPNETAEELRARLAVIGAELVCDTLDWMDSGEVQPVAQEESKATFAPRLKKTDGLIDFQFSAVEIRNLIHGTWPWPGAKAVFEHRGGSVVPVTIARASVVDDRAFLSEPGVLDGELCVETGLGRLRIEQIKPAGKRLMEWKDFVNGYRIDVGDRFIQMEQFD